MREGDREDVELIPADHARMTIDMVRQHLLVDRAIIIEKMGRTRPHDSTVVRGILDILEEMDEKAAKGVSARISGYHASPQQIMRRKLPR